MHDYRSLEHKPTSSMPKRQEPQRRNQRTKQPLGDPNPLILWPVLVVALSLALGLDYLLNRPEMATKMVLAQLLGAGAVIKAWPIAAVIWWRIISPMLLLYGLMIWPITRWMRQKQYCYDGAVYRCRKHPGRCFDCKALAAIDTLFVPLEKAVLYLSRLLKPRR